MKLLRLVITNAMIPIIHALAIFTFKLRNYQYLHVGKCAFYGPPFFLKICDGAIRDLYSKDDKMFNALTTNRYVFWYEPIKLLHFTRHFSVNDSFCYWESNGLVTFFVYAYYKTLAFDKQVFPLTNRSIVKSVNKNVYRLTEEWLVKYSFPEELIQCYKTDCKEMP